MPISFFVFISITELIILAGHYFVYKTLVDFFAISSTPELWLLRIIALLLGISFLGMSTVSFKIQKGWSKFLYALSAYWMSIFYFLLIASALAWIIFGLLPINADPATVAKIALGLGVLFGLYSLIHSFWLRTTEISISLENLPEQWRGKKFVWVSDLHVGDIRGKRLVKRVIKKIAKINPRFLIIGGDLFDGIPIDNQAPSPVMAFNKLKLEHGLLFITGNHEQFRQPDYYNSAIQAAGFSILDNKKIEIDGLQLIGVDDHSSREEKNYAEIMRSQNIDRSKASILFKHVPNHLEIPAAAGISMQMSGHTHNGQVWPFGLLAKLSYKGFNYGLKKYGSMLVYVSSGVGTWGPPGRFLTKAELVIVEFN